MLVDVLWISLVGFYCMGRFQRLRTELGKAHYADSDPCRQTCKFRNVEDSGIPVTLRSLLHIAGQIMKWSYDINEWSMKRTMIGTILHINERVKWWIVNVFMKRGDNCVFEGILTRLWKRKLASKHEKDRPSFTSNVIPPSLFYLHQLKFISFVCLWWSARAFATMLPLRRQHIGFL